MRRRQLFEMKEKQLLKEKAMSIKVPNSNIISNSAQPELKKLANMLLPHEGDIKKVNASPYRKAGSKPGKGAYKKTYSRKELKGE